MYEDAQQIFEYLPIRRNIPENDYINYLWQAFSVLDGGEAIARPFAVMPFHLLFMLSVQYKMLQIALVHEQATNLFFKVTGGRSGGQLLSGQRSVFDMALVNERTIPDVFQLVHVDHVIIKKFKGLVDERNENLAHAKGGIEQDMENKIDKYLEVLESIQKSCVQINHNIADDWISKIETDDDLGGFIESHFFDSRLSVYDFRDIIYKMFNAEHLGIYQWQQVVGKGLELAYDQTILLLHDFVKTTSNEKKKRIAINFLVDNGELDKDK